MFVHETSITFEFIGLEQEPQGALSMQMPWAAQLWGSKDDPESGGFHSLTFPLP